MMYEYVSALIELEWHSANIPQMSPAINNAVYMNEATQCLILSNNSRVSTVDWSVLET